MTASSMSVFSSRLCVSAYDGAGSPGLLLTIPSDDSAFRAVVFRNLRAGRLQVSHSNHRQMFIRDEIIQFFIHGPHSLRIIFRIGIIALSQVGHKAATRTTFDHAAFKNEQYDKLAAHVRRHVDMERIYAIMRREE